MATKTDIRQLVDRTLQSQLTTSAKHTDDLSGSGGKKANETELDNLITSINSELTTPLRLDPTQPADRVISVGASVVVNPETSKNRTIQPINKILPNFVGSTITVPAASTSNIVNSAGDNLLLTISNDSFIKCLVSLKSDGTILLILGVEGATEALATVPSPLNNTLPIGYFVIKTIVAAVQNISFTAITQFSGGGGGSSSSNGDPDTIHLIKSLDDGDSEFTIKSINSPLPNFGGSDTLAASFEVALSGGDALLSNDDPNAVFKFSTAANSQFDAVGFSKSIPAYARGRDIAINQRFRTADTSGDSLNGDYMLWVFDETNGVNTTTSSSGAVSANTNITVGTTTGMTVGQRIWIGETGGTDQVTETHISDISSGTVLQLSDAVNLTSGDRFITGILTSVLTTFDAADSDTDKEGTVKNVNVLTAPNTTDITVMWQQLTTETDSFLFFDNILISSDPFKKVNTIETQFLEYNDGNGLQNDAGEWQFNANLTTASLRGSEIIIIEDDSSNTRTKFIAQRKCSIKYYQKGTSSGTTTNVQLYKNGSVVALGVTAHAGGEPSIISGNINLEANEFISFGSIAGVDDSNVILHLTIEAASNSVVVESADSVISEWEDYTPEVQGLGTITNVNIRSRRVGGTREIEGELTVGTTTGSIAQFGLPNGDVIQLSGSNTVDVGRYIRGITGDDIGMVLATNGDNFFELSLADGSANKLTAQNGSAVINTGERVSFKMSVAVSGLSATNKPLLAFPTITYGQNAESFRADTHAGYGSSAAFIPRFTNERTNTIDNLGTLVNDSTDGCKFTASRRVKVTATYSFASSAAGTNFAGLSLNASGLGTGILALTAGERLAATLQDPVGSDHISWTGIMEPGDILRPHHNSAFVPGSPERVSFSLLIEPEQGQVDQAAIIAQPVVYIEYQTAAQSGANGGATSLNVVPLNTLFGDIAGVDCSISGSIITLNDAGQYDIEWSVGNFAVDGHQSQLFDDSNSIILRAGTSGRSDATTGDPDTSESTGRHSLTTTSSGKQISLKAWHSVSNATNAYGPQSDNGSNNTSSVSVYAWMKITRKK